jgi:hypothetical protein
VFAGDDDQTIYPFLGACPEAFTEPPIPDEHTVVLEQGHRVPVSVHKAAISLIRQVSRRHPKVYDPRPAFGRCERLSSGSCRCPEYYLLSSLEKELTNGKKVMFLTSCSYMLQPLIQVLRKRGSRSITRTARQPDCGKQRRNPGCPP